MSCFTSSAAFWNAAWGKRPHSRTWVSTEKEERDARPAAPPPPPLPQTWRRTPNTALRNSAAPPRPLCRRSPRHRARWPIPAPRLTTRQSALAGGGENSGKGPMEEQRRMGKLWGVCPPRHGAWTLPDNEAAWIEGRGRGASQPIPRLGVFRIRITRRM